MTLKRKEMEETCEAPEHEPFYLHGNFKVRDKKSCKFLPTCTKCYGRVCLRGPFAKPKVHLIWEDRHWRLYSEDWSLLAQFDSECQVWVVGVEPDSLPVAPPAPVLRPREPLDSPEACPLTPPPSCDGSPS